MTTESKTFAKSLTIGQTFFANGVWETVEFVAKVANVGVWVYTRSGESYYYLSYQTVTLRPLTPAL